MGTDAVPMQKSKRKRVWPVVVAAVLLAVGATVLVIQKFPRLLRLMPAADDPILMAGGSLTIRGGPEGKFNVSANDAVYTPANGTIVSADIFYRDAGGAPAFTTVSLDPSDVVRMSYCGLEGSCGAVEAHSNPSGHGFVFGPVTGDTIPPDANMFTHNPATGYIRDVTVRGVTYGCRDASGADGKCSVVVRYCRRCS